jgi:hypothetical protein
MRTIEAVRAAGAALLLCLAGCASAPRHPEAFSFAVMGDTPYTPAEVGPYHAMLKAIDAAPIAFVIHVGDITSGAGDCSEALYAQRRAEFDASVHPFIYTPGDNDWTDCRRTKKDPGERLERLRQVFFADRQSLGRARIEMSVQDRCADVACRCPAHPENRFWTRAGVRFVTLNIPGSNNNEGFDAAGDAEAACRNEANAQWLEQAVRASERSETRGLVIAIQADPWVGMKRCTSRSCASCATRPGACTGPCCWFTAIPTRSPSIRRCATRSATRSGTSRAWRPTAARSWDG